MRLSLIVILTAAALLACTGEGESEPPDRSSATATTTAATSSATRIAPVASTSVLPSGTPSPDIAIGGTRALRLLPSDTRWQLYDPESVSEADQWAWQRLYVVDRDELWTTVTAEGEPVRLSLSPDTDIGIGTAADTFRNRDTPTVLVDLVSGDVREIFPFPVEVRDWSGPGRVLINIDRGLAAPRRSVGWTSGIYELDFATETATLISRARYYRAEVAAPDGSALGHGVLEWRVDPEAGYSALIFRDGSTGDERIVADELGYIGWSPDHRYAALVTSDEGRLSLFDPLRSQALDLDGLGLALGSTVSWSPDSRYFAVRRADPTMIVDVTGLDARFELDALRALGPFHDAIFADWGPRDGAAEPGTTGDGGSGEALLLGEYCRPDGFRLDRVDLETGELTRVPTAVGGFWVYDWSPRGDLIAVSSWDIEGGFTLLDATSGVRTSGPTLDATVTRMQDVAWSASGDWIALHEIGGRDRCMV